MRIKTMGLSLAAVLGVSAVANAAIYEVPVVGCESLSVACDKEQGLIVGAQYVGLVDTTGDFLGKSHQLFSALFLELGWQFDQGADLIVNWDGQFKETTHYTLHDALNGLTHVDIPLSEEHHIVNVEIGKTVHAGPRTNMRFHLGGQYLNIQRSSSRDYSSITYKPISYSAKQEFNGFGPRGGFQGEYWLNAWLAVDGAIAVSVIVGDAKADLSASVGRDDDFVSRSTVRVVTAGMDGHLGAKIDVSKTHPSLRNWPIEILGGYRWYTYPSVMNNTFFDDGLGLAAGQGHFGAHGFYAGLRTKISRDLFGFW